MSQTILRHYLTKSTSKPIAHENQPARGLGSVTPSKHGILGQVVMSHLSHAFPSLAKVGHFRFLSAKRRHTFLSSQARQASFRLDMHNFQCNQPTSGPSATRHSPVFMMWCKIQWVLWYCHNPGLEDTVQSRKLRLDDLSNQNPHPGLRTEHRTVIRTCATVTHGTLNHDKWPE